MEPIVAALGEPPVLPLLVAGKDGERCPRHACCACWLEVLMGSLEDLGSAQLLDPNFGHLLRPNVAPP